MTLHVYDTLRGGKHPFEPKHPGRVGMYVCGMTVQAPPHIGHMRSFLVADVMRKIFRARGYEVTLVQNFTDIDDKIIAKAAEAGRDWKEFAEENIAAYFEAADWMGIERADVYPRATEHIPEILDIIGKLVDKGHAYAADGHVFYDVTSKDDYGKLSRKRLDDLRAGVRIDVDAAKKHPVDFVLWKGAKPGEPAWDSPWGPGRPGWHIECSAMAMKHLGETLDLHGGARDLVFPHHENELAQSEAATGCPFCNHWVQSGLVNLGGQKMSKSTGVLFSVTDVRQETDPETLRLYLLSTHYRSPIEYGRDRLAEAGTALERIRNFLGMAARAAAGSGGDANGHLEALRPELAGVDADAADAVAAAITGFHAALDDDFNTAGALGKLFELVRAGNQYAKEGLGSPHYGTILATAAARLVESMAVLGFSAEAPDAGGDLPAEVRELVGKREEARKAKDWAAADRYRDAIREKGYVVEDRADGPLVKAAG
ncbi:cysteine--tRNA ligase [bacterium]|nr:cysteine--tRNA ligase [bacterium]